MVGMSREKKKRFYFIDAKKVPLRDAKNYPVVDSEG
jgi:hypothetical protein